MLDSGQDSNQGDNHHDSYDVYLLAEPQAGVERRVLVANLAAVFKKDVPIIEKMLRQKSSMLKANINLSLAKKYQAAIEKAGGKCEIVKQGEQPFTTNLVVPQRPSLSLTSINDVRSVSDSPVEELSPYTAPESSLEEESHYCYKCGASIIFGPRDNITRCPKCDTRLIQFNSKDKFTAGLLAFFLGGFGVHRFYLGQWWGIFYLLFWGTLIPSIVSFIEALVFWFTSDERWQTKYGRVPAAGNSTAIVVVVGFFLFIVVSGILAAIAIPAYQDYTFRAKVASAMPLVEETKNKVANVILAKNFYPNENVLAGLPEDISNEVISSIRLGDQAKIVVEFKLGQLKNTSIIWMPSKQNEEIIWDCKGGDLPDKYRIAQCRGGSGAINTNRENNGEVGASNKRIYDKDKSVSLTVPANWQYNRELNSEAIIGAAQLFDETYVIVLADHKADFDQSVGLNEYTDLIQQGMQKSTTEFAMTSSMEAVEIDGMPSKQFSATGTVDKIKVSYFFTVVETNTMFYQIMAWTLNSRTKKNFPLLKKVSDSFMVSKEKIE
jgi:TM2 domain-containing membrane protein YozV/Tfp pilus assembly major pilin PilA